MQFTGTQSSTPRREQVNPPASCATDAFLDSLRREQAAYLDALRQAAARLSPHDGQLACVAASHTRLTQQFFDAQRAILARRAKFDVEVARITATADADADALLAAARSGWTVSSSDASVTRGLPVGGDRRSVARDRSSVSQEVAAIGFNVVRSGDEARALAPLIAAAIAPCEPDGRAAQRELTDLLDRWWSAENQGCLVMLDDARAQAAMRRHLAAVEAAEIVQQVHGRDELLDAVVGPAADSSAGPSVGLLPASAAAPRLIPVAIAAALPRDVVAALASADPGNGGLDAVLAALAATLEPSVWPAPLPPADLVIKMDLVPVGATHHPVVYQPTSQAVERAVERRRTSRATTLAAQVADSAPGRIMLPVVACTSALTILMALIG